MRKRPGILWFAAPLLLLFASMPAAAQDEESATWTAWGADVVYPYIWRGQLYSEGVTVQPWAEVGFGSFALGLWTSASLDDSWYEIDPYVSWSAPLASGGLTVSLNDYYYIDRSGETPAYFDFSGGGEGSHVLELVLDYVGPETLPVLLTLAANVYNDPENAAYAEAGFAPSIGGFDLHAFLGAVLNDNFYYVPGDEPVDAGQIVNLGATIGRSFPVSDRFTLNAAAGVVNNPFTEETKLLLRIGF